jgi:hypothetical protein
MAGISGGTLSFSSAFKWMTPEFGAVIDYTAMKWLDETMEFLKTNARSLCLKKIGMTFMVAKQGPHSASLVVTDGDPSGPFTMAQWAFDTPIAVPAGGFKADPGKNFYIVKPHEKWVFRKRNYISRSGQILGPDKLKGKGFLDAALRLTFTQDRLDKLAEPLAVVTGAAMAHKIKTALTSRGFQVEVT